jgi:hypothetical protein
VSGCPTPRKAAFTEAAARTEAVRIRADERGPAMQPYRCSCGSWHLTRGANLTGRIRGALKESP